MSSSASLGSGSARGNTSVVLIVGVDLVNPLPLLPFLQAKESKLVQEERYPIIVLSLFTKKTLTKHFLANVIFVFHLQ